MARSVSLRIAQRHAIIYPASDCFGTIFDEGKNITANTAHQEVKKARK